MSLINLIHTFIENPFPLWGNNLTEQLVASEWKSFSKHSLTPGRYSTARSYYKNINIPESNKVKIYGTTVEDSIYIEYPQTKILQNFYEDTGLELLPQSEIESINGIEKISSALQILGTIPGILECLSKVVKCIIILKQDDLEIDISHSDPNIPFSIFVSVCEESTEISNLRVAESILHEAMHLKLTMIEHNIDLVVPETKEVYYSPWRDEQRPVRGVLHGLFVFKAILDYYKSINIQFKKPKEKEYLSCRIDEIENEFELITPFVKSNGLTDWGKKIVSMLLQYEN